MSTIRLADEDDLPAITAIHVAAWHAAYQSMIGPEIMARVTVANRLTRWKRCFDEGHHEVYLLEEDSRALGFCRFCPAGDAPGVPPRYGELTHLYLAPERIGSGWGHQLFAFVIRRLETLGYDGLLLWTLEENAPARAFYERHGLRFDGTRKEEPAWLGKGVYEVRYRLAFVTQDVRTTR